MLVEIPVNLHVIEVFQAPFLIKLSQPKPLALFRELGGASYGATFEVKRKLIVFLVVWVAGVLHDDYVQWFEKLSLDREDAIDSC